MFQTFHYTIRSKELPAAFEGFRIAHLSDLHGVVYGRHNEDLLRAIDHARPHCVVMTGDMAGHSDQSRLGLIHLSRRLCAHHPVYYIPGNHEQCLEKEVYLALRSDLQAAGAIVLENSWRTISRQGAFIKLYGLVLPMCYYRSRLQNAIRNVHFSIQAMNELLGPADPGRFTLLLSHDPLHFPVYRDWGADLTLSGHIHGGIIRIPGLGGLLSPDVTLFPRYDCGHFEEKRKHMIVSRGLGNHFLFRVCDPAELAIITLSGSSS